MLIPIEIVNLIALLSKEREVFKQIQLMVTLICNFTSTKKSYYRGGPLPRTTNSPRNHMQEPNG